MIVHKNYLPIRGDSDIYYLDLVDLNRIFYKKWEFFKIYFPSQEWICGRIKDLYRIRVRIAHSSNVSKDEVLSMETYSREIFKQLQEKLE